MSQAIADARAGFVVLDPGVRLEALPPRKPSIWSQVGPVRRGWLLLHDALEAAAVVPPGGGLQQFVEDLRVPVPIDELVAADEVGTDAVAWQLIDQLVRRGFAHRWHAGTMPDEAALAQLRRTWRAQCRHARRSVQIAAGATVADDLISSLRALTPAPSLVIACDGDDRGHAFLERLAGAYQRGELDVHGIVVELPERGPVSAALRACLRRLAARVRLRTDARLEGLDLELVRALAQDQVAVIVRLEVGDHVPMITSDVTRTLHAEHVTAVELSLAWSRLVQDGPAEPHAAQLYAQVEALALELGDVRICGFPSDDEISGEALFEPAPPASELEAAARALHLRTRASYLLELEGKIVWAQDPPAEERWVPSADDLLPGRPELLGLGEGAVVVDVGGGFGRVARRLAPHVGATGAIISIDKEPLISSRARRFAAELGVHTIQFRVGVGQRLPVASDSADAAVLEWGGEIHRDGLLGRCVAEMKRVVRPGKRIAITYRLCNILLERLTETLAPYPEIYPTVLEAVASAGLTIVDQKFWAVQPRLSEAPMVSFEERYLPRLIDDLRDRKLPRQPPSVDLTLTVIAEKRGAPAVQNVSSSSG